MIKIEKIANSVSLYTVLDVRNMSFYERSKLEVQMVRDNTDFVLNDDAVKKITDEGNFDLMILDYNGNDALLG